MFSLYFIIALVNAVLTFKVRQAEKKARDKEEKENTIKLYNTLLNSLSHELRTPISTIIGAVDTLKENKKNISEQTQLELLNEIDKAGIRLNRQVENLLNMSRLESGILRAKLDWIDINEIVILEIKKLALVSHKSITFSVNEQLPFFKLDGGFIEQILQNLLHNAIIYTPDNTIIQIEIEHVGEYCLISISDTGSGFPPDKLTNIFDKFYRLPNSIAGGSGLGLSIVKGFVEALGGTIELTNKETGGALFKLYIPSETSYIKNLKNE